MADKKNKWNWKSKNSIFWGIVLIGAAVMLILQGVGVKLGYGISAWRIILGALCLAWLIDRIIEKHFTEVIFPLAFIFMIFESPIAYALGRSEGDLDLINNWIVLLAALLLTIGLKAIVPEKEGRRSFDRLSSSSIYLDGADLSSVSIHDHMGSVQAFITNRQMYQGGGIINIHDNMGTVKLHIPREWNVTVNTYDNMGRVYVPDQPDRIYDRTIALEIHDNMGTVEVIFD